MVVAAVALAADFPGSGYRRPSVQQGERKTLLRTVVKEHAFKGTYGSDSGELKTDVGRSKSFPARRRIKNDRHGAHTDALGAFLHDVPNRFYCHAIFACPSYFVDPAEQLLIRVTTR